MDGVPTKSILVGLDPRSTMYIGDSPLLKFGIVYLEWQATHPLVKQSHGFPRAYAMNQMARTVRMARTRNVIMEGPTPKKWYVVLLDEVVFRELVIISVILLTSCMSGLRYKRTTERKCWTKMQVTVTKHRTVMIATTGKKKKGNNGQCKNKKMVRSVFG